MTWIYVPQWKSHINVNTICSVSDPERRNTGLNGEELWDIVIIFSGAKVHGMPVFDTEQEARNFIREVLNAVVYTKDINCEY